MTRGWCARRRWLGQAARRRLTIAASTAFTRMHPPYGQPPDVAVDAKG